MKKKSEHTVIAYDLEKPVLDDLCSAARELGVNVAETDVPQDIIAVPSFLSVCDFTRMEAGRLREVFGWFREMSDADKYFKLLFVKPPAIRIHRNLLKSIIRTPEVIDAHSLKMILLNTMTAANRRRKSDRKYDTKIRRLFYILRKLRENGIAYTRDLCADLNVGPRTIERDIDLLIDMGELITFDRSAKRYKLVDSISDI